MNFFDEMKEDYALSLLHKERMRLVKGISGLKDTIISQERWIEDFKVEVVQFEDKEWYDKWYQDNLNSGIEHLNEYTGLLKEYRKRLSSINNAIKVLKRLEIK